MIYLDNNATTRPCDQAAAAVEQAVREHWSNPSSVHRAGQAARQRVELARRSVAGLLGVRPRTLTFTGSGTESIDLALRGSLLAIGGSGTSVRSGGGGATLISARTEHSAVRELAGALGREAGARIEWARIGPDGRVEVGSVDELLAACDGPAIVSIQWANNETGLVQPVQAIAGVCRERARTSGRPVVFHCDATQWVGRMPTRIVTPDERAASAADSPWAEACELDCDLLTCSPHKFHGVKGVGVLYVRPGVRVSPTLHGEQELGRRGGTENVPGIAAAGAAADAATAWLAERENIRRGAVLRDRFERGVSAAAPWAVVNTTPSSGGAAYGDERLLARLWNTSSIAFPRLEAEALLLLLSERGVCASAGAACSSGSLEPSPVLRAMGIDEALAHGSLRFSISRETTEREIDEAVEIISSCAERLRRSMTGAAAL